MGVLSALPLVSAGNICCCLWVVAGGAIAAYMLQQSQPGPLSSGDAALVGLLAGVIGACVLFVVSIPIDIMMAPIQRAFVDRLLETTSNVPPELRSLLESARQQGMGFGLVWFMTRIIGFFFALVIGAIFSTLGALASAAIFRKPTPPNAIDVPPLP
jgi:hypothetical protein